MPNTTPKIEKPQDLPSLLQHFADVIQRSSMDLANPHALVLKLRLSFTPQRKPKGIRRGRKKRCYENAFEVMVEHQTLTMICEGFVLAEGLRIPVEHAWCIGRGGKRRLTTRCQIPVLPTLAFHLTGEWAGCRLLGGAGSLVDELLMADELPQRRLPWLTASSSKHQSICRPPTPS